jgi:hypothetical protein
MMGKFTFELTLIAAAVLLGGCGSIEGDDEMDGQFQAEGETDEAASAIGTTRCISGACVTFESYGDHLYVQDTASDGRGAVGQISGFTPCYNSSGAGTVRDCNYNLSGTIHFRACLGDGGQVLWGTCSVWVPAPAGN